MKRKNCNETAVSEIAILGGACRFPSANDFGDVADILLSGRDALATARQPRWVREHFLHPTPRTRGRTYTLDHGLIANISEFDVELFGISPREAQQMDPQQLLLLEVTHEALEDAGVSRTDMAGSRVGVFVGASFCDHSHRRFMDVAALDGYFMTGAAMSVLANRLSHAFDWKGPSLTVDTACSSALVALHLACQALRTGEVDTAVVGAVNLLLAPEPFIGFAQASLLSPTGRCRPFSAAADGYVRSEGAGAVVLRRRDLLTAADTPRAWVLGTGTNSDGHTNGISLPSATAQAALLRQVYDRGRRGGRRHLLSGGTRDRHRGGRSDRGARHRRDAGSRACQAAAGWFRQIQLRPPGGGERHGRPVRRHDRGPVADAAAVGAFRRA